MKGYTPQTLFELSDDFFDSLGMKRVNQNFWDGSVIERTPGVDMICDRVNNADNSVSFGLKILWGLFKFAKLIVTLQVILQPGIFSTGRILESKCVLM